MADDFKTTYEEIKNERIRNEEWLAKAKESPHEVDLPEISDNFYKDSFKNAF